MNNRVLLNEVSRIHQLMGIKMQENFVISEGIKPLLGQAAEEFAETGVRSLERQAYKTAIEDWGNSYLKLKSGTRPTFDQMVEAGRKKALMDGVTEVLGEGQALVYLAKKTGTLGLTDFANQIYKVNSKQLSTLTKSQADTYVKEVVSSVEKINLNSKIGIKPQTKLQSLYDLIENNSTISTQNKKTIKDAISKQLRLIKSLEDDLITTPKTNEIDDLEGLLTPSTITSSEKKVVKTAKQVDNPTQKFATDTKTFNTRLNQKYGTSLKNKITQSIQENANTRTVDVDECFEGNPSIYDPNKKGQPGWTEDGLKQEFVDLLEEQTPNFLQKLKNGEYKYVTDENGNWDQINMLNTNSGDRSLLFDDFVISKGKVSSDLTNQEVEDLMTEFLNLENSELKKLIEQNKERYTINSVKNSVEGDRIEANFDKRFESGGELEGLGQIVFKPNGRGNPLDFQGYDRILLNKNGEYIPLQIKKSGVIKKGQSVVFPEQENLNFYMFSGVRIKKGYVCVEDPNGNWIVYPPQAQFDTQVISKANKETGIPSFVSYTLKTKDGKPVKEFRRIGGKTYVDISSEPGDEFYTNIDFSKQ